MLTIILAFFTVLALMGALAYALKFLKDKGRSVQWWGGKNIQLLETLHLDTKRKIILISYNQQAHLIYSGPANEFLLQTMSLSSSEKLMNLQDSTGV